MATFVNDKVLTRMVVDYEPPMSTFIADELFTTIPVKLLAGKYQQFARHNSKLTEDIRGNRSETRRLDVGRIPTLAAFVCQEHSHKEMVSEDDIATYGDFMDLAVDTAYSIKKQLLLNREFEAQQLCAATSYYTTPSPLWDATNPTIEKDVEDAIEAYRNQSGVQPNILIVPRAVWKVMKLDSTLRDVWKLVPSRSDQTIKLSNLLRLLWDNFEMILIPDSRYDTSAKGKASSEVDIWGKDVYMLYRAPGPARRSVFTWGAKFEYKPWWTENWPERDPRGTWLKVGFTDAIVEVCPAAIYKLAGVIS